jgi:hypothetical protein
MFILAPLHLLIKHSLSRTASKNNKQTMKLLVFLACVCVCVVCLSGVHAHPDFAAADPVGPSHWELSFFTDVDSPLGMSEVKINITRAWAPIGADHLFALASSGFFNRYMGREGEGV